MPPGRQASSSSSTQGRIRNFGQLSSLARSNVQRRLAAKGASVDSTGRISSSRRSSTTKRFIAVTRPREGGGTVTVTAGGKVTERDQLGRLIIRRQAIPSEARQFVQSEGQRITQESRLKKPMLASPMVITSTKRFEDAFKQFVEVVPAGSRLDFPQGTVPTEPLTLEGKLRVPKPKAKPLGVLRRPSLLDVRLPRAPGRSVGELARVVVEGEQRLTQLKDFVEKKLRIQSNQKDIDDLWVKLSNPKSFGDYFKNTLKLQATYAKGFGQSVARRYLTELPSLPWIIAGRVALADAVIKSGTKESRLKLLDFGKQVPGQIVRAFNPKNPEGLLNIILAGVAVKSLGDVFAVKRFNNALDKATLEKGLMDTKVLPNGKILVKFKGTLKIKWPGKKFTRIGFNSREVMSINKLNQFRSNIAVNFKVPQNILTKLVGLDKNIKLNLQSTGRIKSVLKIREPIQTARFSREANRLILNIRTVGNIKYTYNFFQGKLFKKIPGGKPKFIAKFKQTAFNQKLLSELIEGKGLRVRVIKFKGETKLVPKDLKPSELQAGTLRFEVKGRFVRLNKPQTLQLLKDILKQKKKLLLSKKTKNINKLRAEIKQLNKDIIEGSPIPPVNFSNFIRASKSFKFLKDAFRGKKGTLLFPTRDRITPVRTDQLRIGKSTLVVQDIPPNIAAILGGATTLLSKNVILIPPVISAVQVIPRTRLDQDLSFLIQDIKKIIITAQTETKQEQKQRLEEEQEQEQRQEQEQEQQQQQEITKITRTIQTVFTAPVTTLILTQFIPLLPRPRIPEAIDETPFKKGEPTLIPESFQFLSDLASRIFGIRAKKEEIPLLLDPRRIFTGLEERPLI